MTDDDIETLHLAVHDLRNVLCAIMGNLDLLRSKTNYPDLIRLIDRSIASSTRGTTIAESLSELVRSSTLKDTV
jgi:signal transduction histidine kinase